MAAGKSLEASKRRWIALNVVEDKWYTVISREDWMPVFKRKYTGQDHQ